MKVPPAQESSRCCSHIQQREGRPTRWKPGSKRRRWLGNRSDPHRAPSKLAGRSEMREPCKPRNLMPARSGLREHWECRAVGLLAKAYVDVPALELTDVELPGVLEDGMPGRSGQRKTGTARGWPRRSRTAEASRISRRAVKSRGAREWGGWGRLSVDGSRQHNSIRSEDPWGRWSIPPHGGALSSPQVRLWAGCC